MEGTIHMGVGPGGGSVPSRPPSPEEDIAPKTGTGHLWL